MPKNKKMLIWIIENKNPARGINRIKVNAIKTIRASEFSAT